MCAAMADRRSGILLHPTSLPGDEVQGVLDSNARRFIDFLKAAKQSVWQVLPMGPTHSDRSPYQCLSAHAGNPLLISWQSLLEAGLLLKENLIPLGSSFEENLRACVYMSQASLKHCRNSKKDDILEQFQNFVVKHRWLRDYALYQLIRAKENFKPWYQWQPALRDRSLRALEEIIDSHEEEIEAQCFQQFLFFKQWLEIKDYANENGILMFGDLPIFVAHDSADVWANRRCFQLDESGLCSVIAGVPPDYFSETGQRWGNPLYDWSYLAETSYEWWVQRIKTQLEMFDLFRIDHFRGFEAYWEIPATEDTAINGRWVKGPGAAFFQALESHFGVLPLVAEDLGVITHEVIQLRDQFNFPGMRIMQFAFDGDPNNSYLPHHHIENCVVYTGTHDNNTLRGWLRALDESVLNTIREVLKVENVDLASAIIKAAMESVANLVILPMQDVLDLAEDARMNTPGTTENNWHWRFQWTELNTEQTENLAALSVSSSRYNQ